MGNIILIGVAIFMVAMIAIGLKRGLVRMGFSLVSMLIVLILVNILTPPVKQLIKTTPVYNNITNNIEKYVDDHVEGSTVNMTQTGVKAQKKIIDELPLPNIVKDTLKENNNQQGYQAIKAETFSQYIATSLSDMIVGAVAFAVLFVVLTILMRILVHVLDIVAKLPVINLFNTAGGAIVGLAEALVILWIACIVITIFSATEWGQILCKEIANNGVLSYIYDNNLIQHLITGIFTV